MKRNKAGMMMLFMGLILVLSLGSCNQSGNKNAGENGSGDTTMVRDTATTSPGGTTTTTDTVNKSSERTDAPGRAPGTGTNVEPGDHTGTKMHKGDRTGTEPGTGTGTNKSGSGTGTGSDTGTGNRSGDQSGSDNERRTTDEIAMNQPQPETRTGTGTGSETGEDQGAGTVQQNQKTTGTWDVPDAEKNKKNPVKAESGSISNGKSLWAKHCQSCHGKTGAGDGPRSSTLKTKMVDVKSSEFQAQTDGEIHYKTAKGKGEMPAYEKKLVGNDIWDIVNYMRTLK